MFGIQKISKDDILLYLMIMISADTVLFGTNSLAVMETIRYGFFLILCIYLFFKSPKVYANLKIILIIMSILIMLTGLLNYDLRLGYAYRILLLCAGCLYVSIYDMSIFLNRFVNVNCFIALCALGGFLISIMTPGVLSIFPTLINAGGVSFHNLIVTCIPYEQFGTRLFGPFREPGVFQMYLNLALLFSFILFDKINIKKTSLLVVCIILTKSTTGFVVLATILLFLFFKSSKNKQYLISKRLIIFVSLIGLVFVYLYTDLLSSDGEVFNKLKDTGRSTTISRYGSIICNLQIFADYPIFGAGFSQMGKLFPQYCYAVFGLFMEHNTNMLFIQFATHGIFYGTLWTIGNLLFFKKLAGESLAYLILIITFVCLCAGEDLTWSMLFYLLIFYGFSVVSTKKNKI